MIYLDANATAHVRPEVGAVFERLYGSGAVCGNPSSVHAPGRSARAELRKARHAVMSLLGFADPNAAALVFTSGGTEACAGMVRSLLGSQADLVRHPQHIVCPSIEHPAVLDAVMQLEKLNWQISWVDPAPTGVVSVDSMMEAVRDNTGLVCLMLANNETGAVQPVAALALELRRTGYRGIIAADCIQAAGKMLLDVPKLFRAGVDVIALSGHKLGAPAGIGALLYAQQPGHCSQIHPQLGGGAQEGGLRGGSENLFGACAFGAAAKAVHGELEKSLERRAQLRDLLWFTLQERAAPVECLTPLPPNAGLCNTLLVRFPDCRGDDLVVAFDLAGVAASTGSACASGKQGASHVVKAMGLTVDAGREVVRFSIDWNTTECEVREAGMRIGAAVSRMRGSCSTAVSYLEPAL